MFKNISFILALSSIFLVTSCNTSNLKPDNASTTDPNNGLLLASVTLGKKKESFMRKSYMHVTFMIVQAKDVPGKEKKETKLISFDNTERYFISSHGAGVFTQTNELKEYGAEGRIQVEQLPPGEYAIIGWEIYLPGIPERTINSNDFTPSYFTLKAGEITYIGNLHVDALYGKNLLGITIVGGGQSKCSDMSSRDIMIFNEKFQAIKHLPLSNQIVRC